MSSGYRPESEGSIVQTSVYAEDFEEHVAVIQDKGLRRDIAGECLALGQKAMMVAFEAEQQAATGSNRAGTGFPSVLSFDKDGSPLLDGCHVGYWDGTEFLDHCSLFREGMLMVRLANHLSTTVNAISLFSGEPGPGFFSTEAGRAYLLSLAFEMGRLGHAIDVRLAGLERAAELGSDLLVDRPKKMTAASMKRRGLKPAKERKKEAEQFLRQSLTENPDRRDSEIRKEIATAMGIKSSTLKRYLPAARFKEICAEKKV